MDQRVLLVFMVVCVYQSYSFYLITDYYMSQSHSKSWGGTCEKSIEDACAYINSHINNLRITNYGSNRDCWTILDAGSMKEARYRLDFKYFQLQERDENGDCVDYVEFYDGPGINASTLIGRYCGSEHPNITQPTQRYATVYFKTDSNGNRDGFKIKAVRSEPPFCQDDEYHCRHENRCIDGRLKCEGTQQCEDGQDESDCTAIEKFVGAFLALGLGGLIGVGAGCFTGCTTIGIFICACTCCRETCCPCIGKKSGAVTDININTNVKTSGGGSKKKQKKKKPVDDYDKGDLRDLAMTPISVN